MVGVMIKIKKKIILSVAIAITGITIVILTYPYAFYVKGIHDAKRDIKNNEFTFPRHGHAILVGKRKNRSEVFNRGSSACMRGPRR